MTRVNGKRAIIIGTNYISILTMARDIGEAGYDVDILRAFRSKPRLSNIMSSMMPEKYSKYVKDHRTLVINDDADKLVDMLVDMADDSSKVLLIPVDDLPVKVLDRHYDRLSEYFIVPNAQKTSGEMTRLMDKSVQKGLAKEAGLRTPEGFLISAKDDMPQFPEDFFPCFVKPSVSTGTSKLSMGRCDDIDELKGLLSSAGDPDQSFVVEQYIEGEREHSLVGICIEGEVKACAGFRSVMPGHSERQGVAVMGRTERDDEFPGIIEGVRSLMKLTGYSGMFDIDLLEDKDGKLYFLEINFRAGASCHAFSYEGGMNIPALYAGYYLRNEDIRYQTIKESGKIFLSEKALLEEFVRGDISRETFKTGLNKADVFFVKDAKDKGPYGIFKRYLRLAPILKSVYRFKK